MLTDKEKNTLLVFVLFMVLLILPAGKTNAQSTAVTGSEKSHLYRFNGHYIDLENLRKGNSIDDSADIFNKTGKFSSRLLFPKWFEGYPVKAAYKSCLFEITGGHTIKLSCSDGDKMTTITITQDDGAPENVSGSNFLTAISNGVIHVKRVNGNIGCVLRKYDENGKEIFSTNFEHTHVDATVYQQTYYPYLFYFAHSDKHMVFTSSDKQFPKTVIVDLGSGEHTVLDFIVNGIIRGEDEKEVTGLIVMDTERQTLGVKTNNSKWVVKTGNNYHNRAETLLTGNTLIIATYSPIATGSALAAYDYYTGTLLWQADVKQLQAEHSKYYNAVTLSVYKDKVILEGREAAGNYLQIFNLSDGKRLFAEGSFSE